MNASRDIILIVGPTAGGKTALSIELARQLEGGGECICADSMQVYRGMDIGTAKPTAEEQAAAPHHLLDIADPARDEFSVDTWLQRAEEAIADIRGRGRWPIVVGGTNLYVQALLRGLFEGPAADPVLRERLAALEVAERRAWLERVDPVAAERLHVNDVRRTIRAIEVFEKTGRPLSELQSQWAGSDRSDLFLIGLNYTTEVINRRINARVRHMLDSGLIEETRRLLDAGQLGPLAREALGYRQIIEHLEGACSVEDAVEQIKIRTRRFGKQQRTWLRRFRTVFRSAWFEADDLDTQTIAAQALTLIPA